MTQEQIIKALKTQIAERADQVTDLAEAPGIDRTERSYNVGKATGLLIALDLIAKAFAE